MESPDAKPPSRERSSRRRKRRSSGVKWEIDWLRWAPLAVFAAIVTLAPLLFGAVDRIVQVLLVALLAVGVLLVPPGRWGASRKVFWTALAIAGLLMAKEWAPAGWFGLVRWRSEIDVSLPWTHHPEPARAWDAMLVGLVAAFWWQWVRTLAADGERRVWMAWVLGGAAVVLALVCFAMKINPARPSAIYGFRETEGWVGWGPFPNRNHTSSFLAMGGLSLVGAIWWAVVKHKKPLVVLGGGGLLLVIAALLAGKSRGALLAFGLGLAIFLLLVVCRRRNRRTLWAALGVIGVAGMLLVTFGGKVLARFYSAEQGTISNQTRVLIWKESLGMWKDAPVFGHGVETFPGLFPLYQQADLDGKMVLHPESSWVQWLTEYGLLPTALAAGILSWFLLRRIREAWPQRREFYLTMGMVAGALACLAHAVIDVPGHRWATAGFALALLGTAFPLRESPPLPRWTAVVPITIAAFWTLPFIGTVLPWSASAPVMLVNRAMRGVGDRPSTAEWAQALRFFPLDPWMHHYAGLVGLAEQPELRASWERDLAAARRLVPSEPKIPEEQARAVIRRFPAEAIPLWQEAVDRGGRQWSEFLRRGVRETSQVKGSQVLWGQFIETRPRLALVYAQILMEELRRPEDEVRGYFDIWWEQCARGSVTDDDAAIYYRFAARWSSAALLEDWIKAHPDRGMRDYRAWVALLHGWKQDAQAWEIYRQVVPEPPATELPKNATRETLEESVRVAPANASHALELAHFLEQQGDHAGSKRILMKAAARSDAPPRILREAAYRLAHDGQVAEAVAMALREKPGAGN